MSGNPVYKPPSSNTSFVGAATNPSFNTSVQANLGAQTGLNGQNTQNGNTKLQPNSYPQPPVYQQPGSTSNQPSSYPQPPIMTSNQPNAYPPQQPYQQSQTKPTGKAEPPPKKVVLKQGVKQSSPSLAFSTNFKAECDRKKTAKPPTDKVVLPWDHANQNFVYGNKDYLDNQQMVSRRDVETVNYCLTIENVDARG